MHHSLQAWQSNKPQKVSNQISKNKIKLQERTELGTYITYMFRKFNNVLFYVYLLFYVYSHTSTDDY